MNRRLEGFYTFEVNHRSSWALSDNLQIGYQGYQVPPICDRGLVLGVADVDRLVEPCPL